MKFLTSVTRPFKLACAVSMATLAFQLPIVMAENPAAVAWGQEGEQWLTFTTQHFEINFLSEHKVHAERAATIAENAWLMLTEDLNWTPKDRIQIVLTDDFDFSNGWATPVPFNQMRLYLSPPDGNSSLEYYDDWFNLLITHELTHIVHMDMVGGIPGAIRKVFGRNPLTFPHAYTPGFFVEGLAVYKETDYDLGIGRGQSSAYAMMMREEVINGIDDLSQVAAPLRAWPLGKQYLYGYFYYQFLADTYSEEKITEYLNLYSRNVIPFFLQNWDADTVFGKSHEVLWDDFQTWLNVRFEPQISKINEYPLVEGKQISHEGLFLDAAAVSEQHYFYGRDNGEDRFAIIKRDTQGGETIVAEIKSLMDMDVNKRGDVLYTRAISRDDRRLFADIFRINAAGESERLTEGERYRNVRWINIISAGENEKQQAIIAKRIDAGISQLDQLTKEGTLIETLWTGSLDDVLGEYNVSPDGRFIIANIKRAQQGWNLEVFDLEKRTWKKITNTKAIESQARYSTDGKHIIFSADYDETFNLYQLELATGKAERLTRVMGGAFKPLVIGSQLYYQSYDATGYNHALMSREALRGKEGLESFNIQQVFGQFNYPDLYEELAGHSETEEYSPWSTLMPTTWLPVIAGTDEYDVYGAIISGADALGRHNYSLGLFQDTKNDLSSGSIIYSYDNKWQLSASRSHKYGTLLFQDKLNIRQEDNIEIARINLFNAFENTLTFSLGANSSIERDIKSSTSRRIFEDKKNAVVGGRLDFDNTEFYSQSNSPSWGSKATVLWESNDYLDSDYKGDVINASFSHFFDLPGKQVIAINTQGAYGFESPEPFELGGNNINFAESLFGRDTWSLRGYDERVQQGNRIQTSSLEYRFPIASIERNWDLLPIGLGNISGTVFSDHGSAWSDNDDADYLTSAGIELNVEVVIAYGVIFPVKLGYAKAFDRDEGGNSTYMSAGFAF